MGGWLGVLKEEELVRVVREKTAVRDIVGPGERVTTATAW